METIELSAAMAAVLKDNANPANLIGLNGSDLTKTTMQQVAAVAGGLKVKLSNGGANNVLYEILDVSGGKQIASILKMEANQAGAWYALVIVSCRKTSDSNSFSKESLTKNSIQVFTNADKTKLYINVSAWCNVDISVMEYASGGSLNPIKSDIDVSTLTEIK